VRDEEREFECTKIEMSKIVFEQITSDENLKNLPIVLFLNRSDLIASRIKTENGLESFKEKFPDYKGGKDPDKAMECIKNFFMSVVEKDKKGVKHHYTNALDRDAMTVVFNATKEYILSSALNTEGVDV